MHPILYEFKKIDAFQNADHLFHLILQFKFTDSSEGIVLLLFTMSPFHHLYAPLLYQMYIQQSIIILMKVEVF